MTKQNETERSDPMPTPRPMRTIQEIAQRNAAAGLHWFEPATLRFFGGRMLATVWQGAGGRAFFVSSERQRWSKMPRFYSVRVASPDGQISTVGLFQEHTTAARAKTAAAVHARADRAAAAPAATLAPGLGAPAW